MTCFQSWPRPAFFHESTSGSPRGLSKRYRLQGHLRPASVLQGAGGPRHEYVPIPVEALGMSMYQYLLEALGMTHEYVSISARSSRHEYAPISARGPRHDCVQISARGSRDEYVPIAMPLLRCCA